MKLTKKLVLPLQELLLIAVTIVWMLPVYYLSLIHISEPTRPY